MTLLHYRIVHFFLGGVNNIEEKPFVLWSLYFNMETGVSSTDTIPSNVRITSLPSVQPDFEDAINEVSI